MSAAEESHPGGCGGNGFNISVARPERRLREKAVRDVTGRIGQEQRCATVEEVVRPLIFAGIGKIDELCNADRCTPRTGCCVPCKRHAAREADSAVSALPRRLRARTVLGQAPLPSVPLIETVAAHLAGDSGWRKFWNLVFPQETVAAGQVDCLAGTSQKPVAAQFQPGAELALAVEHKNRGGATGRGEVVAAKDDRAVAGEAAAGHDR